MLRTNDVFMEIPRFKTKGFKDIGYYFKMRKVT